MKCSKEKNWLLEEEKSKTGSIAQAFLWQRVKGGWKQRFLKVQNKWTRSHHQMQNIVKDPRKFGQAEDYEPYELTEAEAFYLML